MSIVDDATKLVTELGIVSLDDKNATNRARMIGMCMLAIAGIKTKWSEAKSTVDKRKIQSKKIVEYLNENFSEYLLKGKISRGSYDSIRDEHVMPLVRKGYVVPNYDNPKASKSSPNYGYSLDHNFKEMIVKYKSSKWADIKAKYLPLFEAISDADLIRKDKKIVIAHPSFSQIELEPTQHNLLQKHVIDKFLPRFIPNSDILYIGDSSDRYLHYSIDRLRKYSSLNSKINKLPDIIVEDTNRQWLILIEAVHSHGPITTSRIIDLKEIFNLQPRNLVFVSVFVNKSDLREWIGEIAWESEVWISSEPDHMLHFNGSRFLGPY